MLSVKLAAVLLLGSLAAACGGAPPPPPPQPAQAPAPAPPPPPPPPPAPTCESLDEKCVAIAETKLAVGDEGATFHPPDGWLYAREGNLSLATAPDEKAVMGFAVAAASDRTALAAALDKLFERLGIEGVARKTLDKRLRKAQHQLQAAGGPIWLWEVDHRSQRGRPVELRGKGRGTLLVVTAKFGGGRIVGCGFVVKPDADPQAQVIMQAVESLIAPASAQAAGTRMEEI